MKKELEFKNAAITKNKKKELGLGPPNPKVQIYVKTAAEIFERCFSEANSISVQSELYKDQVINKKNKFYDLETVLDQTYTDNPIKETFLRNKNREIIKAAKNNIPNETIGFDHHQIYALAFFAGVENYMVFNEQYSPQLKKQVLFTPTPFKLFDLIRVPQPGFMSEIASDWVYTGNNNEEIILRNINKADPFIMAGDRSPFWIELSYTGHDGFCKAYFAENVSNCLKPITDTNSLLVFFRKLIV